MKFILIGILVFLSFRINVLLGYLVTALLLAYILYKNFPLFYANKGNIAINKEDFKTAINYYEKAFKTQRASASIALRYGMLLLREGYVDEAITIFNLMIVNQNYKPDFKSKAKQYRTLAYFKRGDVEDAIEEAEEIFDSYKNTVSYGLYCYIKLATNTPVEEILPLCVEAYDYNSDDRDICDNLALAYIKNNEPEKAKEICVDMLEKFPTFVEAYYHLAFSEKMLGNKDRALELINLIEEKCKRTFLTTISTEEIESLKNELMEQKND